ncbi:PBECR4 domain-containing protein [Streptococcus sp. ZJ93]|uniref:PBECR4 domain-containing protein n=1 Tax=Streptococcus handemini TaxID=3161188 RepID=UPI0032EFAA85
MVKRVNEYGRPSFNEKLKLKRYLGNIQRAARFFEEHFINKSVVYCTSEDRIEVRFSSTNFMHLCGITYKKGSHSFFVDSLNQHLIIDDMMIKKDGTSFQKLQVLASITEILGSYVHLTGSGRYLYLEFDYALRTKKQILALTLKDISQKIIPQSLLDLKNQKSFPVGVKVVCIYSKDIKSGVLTPYFIESGSKLEDYLL